jgi:drug/metabolite transporter (DMT)-like permease
LLPEVWCCRRCGAVVGGATGGGSAVGPLAVASACLCWAIDNNLTRQVSAADPVRIAAAKGLVAGAVNTEIAFATGAAMPEVPAILGAAGVGFVGYGVSLACFVLALRHLGTARTGAYFSTAPSVGAVVSLLVGEGTVLMKGDLRRDCPSAGAVVFTTQPPRPMRELSTDDR